VFLCVSDVIANLCAAIRLVDVCSAVTSKRNYKDCGVVVLGRAEEDDNEVLGR
jgi:hypothetical protein